MLDELPQNCTLLVLGPPGVGKLDLLLDMGRRALARDEKVVFVTTDVHPREVKNSLLSYEPKAHFTPDGSIRYVDGYSSILDYGFGLAENDGVYQITNLSRMGEMIESISRACEELGKPVRVLFYTLSTLFLYNSVRNVAKFFGTISSRIKTEYGFGAFAVQEGIHEETTVNLLSSMVDGVVQMRFNEALEREWRLHHLKGTTPSPRWEVFEKALPRNGEVAHSNVDSQRANGSRKKMERREAGEG